MLRYVVIAAAFAGLTFTAVADQPPAASPQKKVAAVRTAPERAWDDLRWLMTALEAYSTDNDALYAPPDGNREGAVSALDHQMEWYYGNTYPVRPAPRVDPWGNEYRFVVSKSRKLYALYSLGPDKKLQDAAKTFLERLKNDEVRDDEMQEPQNSRNIVVSGRLLFAPAEVLKQLVPVQ